MKTRELNDYAKLINNGELVAFPTETVYGLAANVFDPIAIQKIFDVKGRPQDNPLIIHCATLDEVSTIAIDIPPLFYTLATYFLPGPLTIILKKHPDVPDIVSAGLKTVGVRIPRHPVAQAFIKAIGHPIVAPSANRSGYPSPTTAKHVDDDLNGKIAAIIDGGTCDLGIESTVVNILCDPCTILRPGSITQQQLEKKTGLVFHLNQTKTQHRVLSPGMKYRHYAPDVPIKLAYTVDDIKAFQIKYSHYLILIFEENKSKHKITDKNRREFSEHNFYALLRKADQEKISQILIYIDESLQSHEGLMNRILKAAIQ